MHWKHAAKQPLGMCKILGGGITDSIMTTLQKPIGQLFVGSDMQCLHVSAQPHQQDVVNVEDNSEDRNKMRMADAEESGNLLKKVTYGLL